MHDPKIVSALIDGFHHEEVEDIVDFLERDFSPEGERLLGDLFLRAGTYRKKPCEVLPFCEKEWERVWKRQAPSFRGDPQAPGWDGIQNVVALDNIYHALSISNPIGKGVRREPLVVKTTGSTYTLSTTNEAGERFVSRWRLPPVGRLPLPASQWVVISIVEGLPMRLVSAEPGCDCDWDTSPVVSVDPG